MGLLAAALLCGANLAAFPRSNAPAASTSTLTFSTFLGGSNFDQVWATALDAAGNIYVTGQTASSNFPTRVGGQDGNRDIFIGKLDPTANHFLYLTVLGGLQTDTPKGIAVDASGNAYVTGYTSSTDFPTTVGAYRTTSGGQEDAFVVKLNATGQKVYSTYLGGAGRDFASAIAVDAAGNAYITGYTSGSFPIVSGAFQPTFGSGLNDVFITKLNPAGTALVYSTYFGGIGNDTSSSIAVDATGNAYICGQTDSANFPTSNALLAASAGDKDAFVTKLDPAGSALIFSTYLGGSLDDLANSIAIDASLNVYIAGVTASWNFPVSATAFQRTMGGGLFDAFVTKLSSSGTTLAFSTFLGGTGSDQGIALAVDSAGNSWLAGSTSSSNFPLVNALQALPAGQSEAFVTTLNSTGDQLLYSSYVGGGLDDSALSIAIDNKGSEIVGGSTMSSGFPSTAGVIQPLFGGSYDGFVLKLLTGVCPYNVSPSSLNVAAAGASGSISATAPIGCSAPTASSNVAWATVGVVGSSVNWTVASNPSSLGRNGNLTVAGQTVPVTQAGGACSYTLTPTSLNIASGGGAGSINITPSPSDCPPATASSNVGWASATAAGNTASWSAVANPSWLSRSGSFTIGGKSVAVSQLGGACSYGLSTANISAGPGGAAGSITITPAPSDCPPATASSNVGWASVSVSGNAALWSVSPYAGSQTRNGSFTVAGQAVAVSQTGVSAPGTLTLNRTVLNFGISGSLITSPQTVIVGFTNGSGVVWTVSSNQPNITVSPSGGAGSGSFDVTAAAGASGVVTVSAPGAAKSPLQVQINVAAVTPAVPTGSFDTPASGTSGIAGAIAVTGWALDNIEVTKVDIWREPVGAEPAGLQYIGDAIFVSDARPDVEGGFPLTPFNYRAGWGYMLLTNFLPNNGGSAGSGNGTYKLHAIAHDKAGHTSDLGTHTITVDNAHASRPFGSIDTPAPGATISGNAYANFGWALTQNPFNIPVDASTITVTVDGQTLGHPAYNFYRADIANSFPGLANSGGAIGFFYIDTTSLSNGVHTIGWLVYDNQGRGDGIGSRFFTVLNSGGATPSQDPVVVPPDIVSVRRGHDLYARPELVRPQADVLDVEMEELERIELDVGTTRGFLIVNGEQRPLPAGSSLRRGVFYWHTAPGFLGEYSFVFERPGSADLTVRVSVRPKQFR